MVHLFEKHNRHDSKFQSFFTKDGRLIAAQLADELENVLKQFPNAKSLSARTLAGVIADALDFIGPKAR